MKRLFLSILAASLVIGCGREPTDRARDAATSTTAPKASPAERSGEEAWARVRLLLRARSFEELEELLHGLQEDFRADPENEVHLFRAYGVFGSADSSLLPLLEDWTRQRPESGEAHLALAEQLSQLGWEARGGAWADETSEERFARMLVLHARAERAAARALELDPRLTEAWSVRIDLAKARGARKDCARWAEAGLAVSPASFGIRRNLSTCHQPRWGGSWKAMEGLASEARPLIPSHSRLAVLGGLVAADRADAFRREDDFARALEQADEALRHADYFAFHDLRGDILSRMGDLDEALAAYDRAIELAPTVIAPRLGKARVLRRKGRLGEALESLLVVAELSPEDRHLGRTLRATAEPALEVARDLVRSEGGDAALAILEPLARLRPGDDTVRYWAGRAHLKNGDLESSREHFRVCLDLEPGQFECAVNLDWIWVQTREWDKIVATWDRYLEAKPDDGRAFLERAGARRHGGDTAGAFADLDRACTLGVEKACELRRSVPRPPTG